MSTFDGTLMDTTVNQTIDTTAISCATSSSSSSDNITMPDPRPGPGSSHQVFVQSIGWASQSAKGEIWVRFQDGTQLGVKSNATTVVYVDVAGQIYKWVYVLSSSTGIGTLMIVDFFSWENVWFLDHFCNFPWISLWYLSSPASNFSYYFVHYSEIFIVMTCLLRGEKKIRFYKV